jgi:hypothetical protein
MATIELTHEQRQALQVEPGRPVEVLDPATQQRYVLLARDQYERLRPLLEGSPEQGPSPPVAPSGVSLGEADVPRVRLRDLATPPEIIAEAERCCKKYGWLGKARRREVVEQLKLQYYYGGQEIYLVRTPEGPVVVPIPERYRDTPGLRYVLLTPEERRRACLTCPSPWQDTDSEILS